MSIHRTLAFFVLLVVASQFIPNSWAQNEVHPAGHSDIKYVDSSAGSPSGIVTLPPAVHHAEDRSGLAAEPVASPSVSTIDHHTDGTAQPAPAGDHAAGAAGEHGTAGEHGGGGGHGGGHEGIHVFTAEFARVEIPFIISLWIFCASLAKIGGS